MTELLVKPSAGEEDMRLFLSEIRRYPLLTPEEERALAKKCVEGDEEAIRQMVSSNLRLVVSIARKYAGRLRICAIYPANAPTFLEMDIPLSLRMIISRSSVRILFSAS